MFHSVQVFHELVCPLTVVLPQIFFNLTTLFSYPVFFCFFKFAIVGSGQVLLTCTGRNKTLQRSTSLPVMGKIAGVSTASLGGYLHSSKTRARWAEGFRELNGHVFDLERDGLRQVVFARDSPCDDNTQPYHTGSVAARVNKDRAYRCTPGRRCQVCYWCTIKDSCKRQHHHRHLEHKDTKSCRETSGTNTKWTGTDETSLDSVK